MASALDRLGTAVSGNRSALTSAVGALRDPSSLAVTFRSTITPPYTVYPLSPVPQERRAPSRFSVGGLVMSALRPSVDVQAGGGGVTSIQAYGDPEALPLGKGMIVVTAAGIALAIYGGVTLLRKLF